jgi:phage antirepressor YoqD-like protein
MTEPERPRDKRMTVREVAEVLGVDNSTVTKRVRALFPQKVRNGVTTYLDEAEVTVLKMELQHNGHLGQLSEVATMPKTDLEKELMVQQALMYQQEKIKNLTERLAIAEPKAAFFDQVAESKDAIKMRNVAAVLNIPNFGRNKLFALLREKKILDVNNIPYREYQERGYFRVIEQQWTDKKGKSHIYLKTLVYQRGIDFIRKVQGALHECSTGLHL